MQPTDTQISCFRKGLSEWKDKNGLRKFQWRDTSDDFQLLITEILLRRTRSQAVSNLWDAFFTKYNYFEDFIINQESLKHDLQPLGLSNTRTEDLLKIAKLMEKEEIPNDEIELMKLPGVGKYISRMYLVMSARQRKLVFDSNFRRVYNRFYGLNLLLDLKRDKLIEPLSERIIPKKDVKEFLLTVLDFAAATCKPQTPLCEDCFMTTCCRYFSEISMEVTSS